MPILDLRIDSDGARRAFAQSDVCVVGTGAAGTTLARELSRSSLRVTLLESGGFEREPDVDALNDVENVGRDREPNQWTVRNRLVGGSTHTWGGRSAPFDEIDFEKRDWVPGSGWPFGLDELEPYLDRSALHLGLAPGFGFSDDRFWRLSGRTRPKQGPDPRELRSFFWQHSLDEAGSYPFEYVRMGRHLARSLGDNVTLVTHANVLRAMPAPSGGSIQGVEVAAPDGSRFEVRASIVVLATGGIENPRLLLASDSLSTAGLGNQHDLVGRYLMDHPRGPVGSFTVDGSEELQKRLGRYNVHGHLFRAGFRLSPDLQREEQLLNCAVWLGEVVASDDPWEALRRLAARRPVLPDDLKSVVRGWPYFGRGLRDYFVERNGFPRKYAGLQLLAMVEQRPDPESRVTLSERRDRFGMRLPRVDWRTHEDEERTMRRAAEVAAEQLAAMGLPAPRLAEWVRVGGAFPTDFRDVAHPTGTTRMGADPTRGVVDASGAVYGTKGLYVAGSSTFPTAGHCNPTQMIVALAVRLADHIKAHLATPERPTVTIEPASPVRPAATRVLLTGARGRIGRIVLEDLLARGYVVRAVTSGSLPQDDHRSGLEWRQFDLATGEPNEFDALVAGCQAVLHLAAEIGRMDRMPAVNAEATRRLAEAAERGGVQAFCYTSTVSVYGSGQQRDLHEDGPVLTHERDVPGEYWALDYVRAYGRTKLGGELAIKGIAKRTRFTILRPTVVVDVPDLVASAHWGRARKALTAHRHAHHVYVRDVSEALIWAMNRHLEGRTTDGVVEVYNLAEDDLAEPTHAAFLRRALEATGDPRFKTPTVPGAVDWFRDFARFRRSPGRRPLWRMRFSDDRIRRAGYHHLHGMEEARALALSALRREREHSASRRERYRSS